VGSVTFLVYALLKEVCHALHFGEAVFGSHFVNSGINVSWSTLMRCLGFVLASALFSAVFLPGEETTSTQESKAAGATSNEEKQIQEILSAQYPYKTGLGPGTALSYQTFFKKVGAEGVRRLQMHGHDGIAIQAAWEEVMLSFPEKEPERAVPLNRDKLTWFLGFLQGRARVQVPRWWADVLLGSHAYHRYGIFPGRPKEELYHWAGLDSTGAPHDTSLRREGDKIFLSIGKESVQLPDDLLEKNGEGRVYSNVSALMTPSRCYVAVHGDVGYPYRLVCVERSSAKVAWKSDVWATWWAGAENRHDMWVAVTEQNKRIVVFGAADTGFHVEAFRPEDGANLFRFSTRY
jgi:hypothetical protein